jgi:hypothetical protein
MGESRGDKVRIWTDVPLHRLEGDCVGLEWGDGSGFA